MISNGKPIMLHNGVSISDLDLSSNSSADVQNSSPSIGYLLKTYPKLSETFILNEMVELERQGVELHIFSLRRPTDTQFHSAVAKLQATVTYIPSILPKASWEDWQLLFAAHQNLFRTSPLQYLEVLKFHLDRSEKKSWNEFLQAGYLALALQRFGIDHLHAHFANVPAATAELAKQFCGITYSITAHAKDIYLSDPAALNRKMAAAEFVLTCTDFNCQFLKTIATPTTQIHLGYHGIDLTRFQKNDLRMDKPDPVTNVSADSSSSHPFLLSVGRFCEKKGFPYLLEACFVLKNKGFKFRCAIVGYGPMQAEIEQQIEAFGIEDIVSLLGKLTQDKLIEVYHEADVFVLPCLVTDDGDRDGIPNVLLEAMAMNVPVVSTDVSGISELIESGKNGILVPEKDAEAIACALEKLLLNSVLRSQFGRAGREKVCQQFTLETNVGQVKDLLLNVLRHPSLKGVGGFGNFNQSLEEAIR